MRYNRSRPSYRGIPTSGRSQPTPVDLGANLTGRTNASSSPKNDIDTFLAERRQDSGGAAVDPTFLEPPLPLPRNGLVKHYTRGDPVAPLEIRTSGTEHHYFIKLAYFHNNAPVLTVFVRGGQSVSLKVPLGTMKLRYAVGSTWYGERFLFGPETAYAEADAQFDFMIENDRITGYTIELYPQPNGNLRERRIGPDRW